MPNSSSLPLKLSDYTQDKVHNEANRTNLPFKYINAKEDLGEWNESQKKNIYMV